MTTRDQPLELVPVGVGAAYAAPGEAQSCYLVRAAGRHLCLDLGAGALNRLQVHVAPEELDLVVISHLHPDHMIDLLALRVYMAWGPGRGRRLRVIGPAGLRDRIAAHGEDGLDAAFSIDVYDGPAGSLDLGGGVTLRYREVPHLEPTYALRVEHGARALCYGADCAPNTALAELARDADLLVCECSFGVESVPQGVAHMNARDAAGVATRAGAGRLLLTHCYPEFDRDVALAAARGAFAGPVEWAVQDRAVAA